MASTLKNIAEVIEECPEENSVLERRRAELQNYRGLGPPDMVYLHKSFQRSLFGKLKKPKVTGYYFYCYGVDCTSMAAVSAFL